MAARCNVQAAWYSPVTGYQLCEECRRIEQLESVTGFLRRCDGGACDRPLDGHICIARMINEHDALSERNRKLAEGLRYIANRRVADTTVIVREFARGILREAGEATC